MKLEAKRAMNDPQQEADDRKITNRSVEKTSTISLSSDFGESLHNRQKPCISSLITLI